MTRHYKLNKRRNLTSHLIGMGIMQYKHLIECIFGFFPCPLLSLEVSGHLIPTSISRNSRSWSRVSKSLGFFVASVSVSVRQSRYSRLLRKMLPTRKNKHTSHYPIYCLFICLLVMVIGQVMWNYTYFNLKLYLGNRMS